MSDRDTELRLVAGVAFKAVSVVGRLARRLRHDDLADELEVALGRVIEVLELEQMVEEVER